MWLKCNEKYIPITIKNCNVFCNVKDRVENLNISCFISDS